MYFKQILNEENGCSSYVIASRQTHAALVVDAALATEQYLELASNRQFHIEMVIDTHIHADHVSGSRKLAAAVGAQLALHESTDVRFPFRGLADGELIRVGQLLIKVVHTPGHRPEAISLVVTNPPRGNEPSLVLTGDCLFVGDVGRPDFGGREGARQQFESVHKLMKLEDYVGVFPAHFEGSCGKGMCGRPSSTIGFERRFNPMLALGEEDFVEATSETPARPLNMTAIVATNRGEADMEMAEPHSVPSVPEIDVAAAPSWVERQKPLILDVREPEEFASAHLPGAISLPQSEIATSLDTIPQDREVLVVCAGGVRSLRTANFLIWSGRSKVSSLAGGTGAWVAAGNSTEGSGTAASGPDPSGPERYMHGAS